VISNTWTPEFSLPTARMFPVGGRIGDSLVVIGGGDGVGAQTSRYLLWNAVQQETPDTTGQNVWYVNDTSTAGDSYTSAPGADTNVGYFRSSPFRTLNFLEGKLSAGDTIFVDSGIFIENDTFRIDTSGIFLVGVDSRSTRIQFDQSGGGPARAIYAQNVAGLTLRDFSVGNGFRGLWFENVDASTVRNVRADTNADHGIGLTTNSDANLFLNVASSGNGANGVIINASSNNTFNGGSITGNTAFGVQLAASGSNNFANLRLHANSGAAFVMSTSTSNVFTGNTVEDNFNTAFSVSSTSDNNSFRSNIIRRNYGEGFYVGSSSGNYFAQNQVDSNDGWAVNIDIGSTSDTFEKNIILPPSYRPDSGVYHAGVARIAATRNWWGTTDSSIIRGRITPPAARDSIVYTPYRLGVVDTVSGGDTVAPKAPDTVTASGASATTVQVAWSNVSASEEPEASVSLQGFAIYRSNAADSTFWELRGRTGNTNSYTDSSLTAGVTHFYRVAAFDATVTENQSFYSDSIPSAAAGGLTADTSAPPGVTGQYDTLVLNILDSNNSVHFGQSSADTLSLTVCAPDFRETWLVKIPFSDTGNIVRVRRVTDATFGASDTSRIRGYSYGAPWRLEVTVFDSTGAKRPDTYWNFGESPTLTFEFKNTGLNPNRTGLFWLNTGDSDWYDVTQSDSGMSAASYIRTADSFSIAINHFSHFFPGEGQVDTVTVVIADTIPSVTVGQGVPSVTVMALYILADTAAGGDTLTRFTLASDGNLDTNDILAVRLARDANANLRFDLGVDTFVSLLYGDTLDPRRWDTFAAAIPIGANGDTFLIAVDFAPNATNKDTFQARIPAFVIDSFDEETGPTSARQNAGVITVIDTAIPNVWYVNDTSTSGDSFTSAVGLSGNYGLSGSSPKRYLNDVEPFLTAGDTVYVDGGFFYESDTFSIDTDGIFVIGMDSASTVIRFDLNTAAAARTIYCTGISSITIRDLEISNSRNGLLLRNVDSATIERIRIDTSSSVGMEFSTGSDNNTVRYILIYAPGNNGLSVTGDSSLFEEIVINNATTHGVLLQGGSNDNVFRRVFVSQSANNGFFISGPGNRFIGNTAANAGIYGFNITTSNNYFAQNTIYGSGDYAIRLGSGGADTFEKNNILPSATPESGVWNQAGSPFQFTRNWWGTTDSAVIAARINSAVDGVPFAPFRLDIVDTSIGADTVAPKAPDTVAAKAFSPTGVRVTWKSVTLSEEPESATAVAGFRVYRSNAIDSNYWMLRGATGVADNFIDSGVGPNETHYYRVSTLDGATFVNASFFSDSIMSATTPFSHAGANAWFVNDSSLAGDTFTGAIGDSWNHGQHPSYPKSSLNEIEGLLSEGDTVYIDSGTCQLTDTVSIDTNGILLLGVDSTSTVLQFDSTAASALRALYASNRNGLVFRDFRVTGGRMGIWLSATDSSLFERIRSNAHGLYGFYIDNSSGDGSDSNAFLQNLATGNSTGWLLNASQRNILAGNKSAGNAGGGFDVNSSSHRNTFIENISTGNGSSGFAITASNNEALLQNSSFLNSGGGFAFSSSFHDTIISNTASGNSGIGFSFSTSSNNRVYQNTVDSSANWAFSLSGTSNSDTFHKNVIIPSIYSSYADSGVYCITTSNARFDFSRNWWSTSDSATIRNRIWPANTRDSVLYHPFRLGIVDTAPLADTVAPRAPDSVSAHTCDPNTIRVTWDAVVASEETESSVDLSGYRIYRAPTSDTSSWVLRGTVSAATLLYDDSNVPNNSAFFYRVASFDNHSPCENQSFYSDSIPSDTTTTDTMGPNVWYLNDGSTSGDSFTTVAGDTTLSGLARDCPKLYWNQIEPFLTQGDSVFIDAGTYFEPDTFRIDTINISVIGVDSNSTTIDFDDTSVLGSRGLYFNSVFGCTLQNLAVRDAARGVWLLNTTNCNIDGVRLSNCGSIGASVTLMISGGASNNTVNNCEITSNVGIGLDIGNANNNTVRNSISSRNTNHGFSQGTSTGNTWINNKSLFNQQCGFNFSNNSDNNFIYRNLAGNNQAHGFNITNTSTGNILDANVADSNVQYAFALGSLCNNDAFRKNIIVTSPQNPDSGVYNPTANTFDFTRNWWGTTDSSLIRKKLGGTGQDKILYVPFRLGTVDSAGVDTVAPKAPDSVSAKPSSPNTARIFWNAVTTSEESEALGPSLSAYRVYRSNMLDSTFWVYRGQITVGTTVFTDSGLAPQETAFYRISSVDGQSIENQSFFSDSAPFVVTPVAHTGANFWFVNDTDLSGDSYTGAMGDSYNYGQSLAFPKRSLNDLEGLVSEGDTILIDSGIYYATDTITFETNAFWLLGVDSASTVIDFNDTTVPSNRFLHCSGVNGITIRDLRVRAGVVGITWTNVDSSSLLRVATVANKDNGFSLRVGSDFNTVTNCLGEAATNGNGFSIDGSSGNQISGSTMRNNWLSGFILGSLGFGAENVLSDNIAIGNGSTGFFFNNASASRMVRNSVTSNGTIGFRLLSSSNNIFEQNTSDSNATWAVSIEGSSTTDTFHKNNFAGSIANPDSVLFSSPANPQDLRRNWWGTSDSGSLRAKIWPAARRDSIAYHPFRLGIVDTALFADTVAPRAPDTVATFTLGSSSIRITWATVTSSEETESSVARAGYRVYRSNMADSTGWIL
ncbi:MAG: right-handed parallel beta-helix repeat-containing protein, partial [Candidatus Hydrogenedentota bacterium]